MEILSKESIKAALAPVFRVYNIRKAILFGSYAKGTADAKSDIDLYVDSGGLRGMKFVGFIENTRKALNDKEVDIFDVSHINHNSKIMDEVKKTGELIYER